MYADKPSSEHLSLHTPKEPTGGQIGPEHPPKSRYEGLTPPHTCANLVRPHYKRLTLNQGAP